MNCSDEKRLVDHNQPEPTKATHAQRACAGDEQQPCKPGGWREGRANTGEAAMIDFDDDLNEMLRTDEFATTAAFALQNGSAGQLTGIFTNEGEETGFGDVGMIISKPVFAVKTSEIPAEFGEGAELLIDGQRFTAASAPMSDGHGLSQVLLERE